MPTMHPGGRLMASGEVVSFEDDSIPLPNYSGLVYANLVGRPYILWLHPETELGRRWEVINAGSVVVQSAFDRFIKENTTQCLEHP